mmetsp:Transcript_5063/g.16751  ORF Transcript_5063/g.16751 Transcript_5063/m.16751 type:complete len:207 (+) Transcript_5063:642-1262(+)
MVRWPAGAASQKASALTPPHRPPAWAENGAPAGDRPVPAAYRPTETKPSAAPHARAAAPPAARGTRSMAVRFPPSPAPGRAGGGASSPCRSSSCCQTDAPPPRTAATAIEDADSRARDTRSACPGIATSPVVLKTCSVVMAPSVARSRQTKRWPSLATEPTKKPSLALARSSDRNRMSTTSRVCPRSKPSASVLRSITRITPVGMA